MKHFQKKVVGHSWQKIEKEDWKPKKKEGPDMGTYDPGSSIKAIGKQTKNTIITKVKIKWFLDAL